MKTGIYNIETCVGEDGKPYIMEVSPRGGGCKIAELQTLAYGIDLIETDFVSIIDSDDYLTDDAIATYKKYIKKYGSNEKVGVISFNKCDPSGEKIGKKFKEKEGCVLFFGSGYSMRKKMEPGVVLEHLIPP